MRRQVLQLRCGLAAFGFRFRNLTGRQATLPIGFAGLVMLIKELRGASVHPGRLVVDGGRMLMHRNMRALMLLVLAIRFAHNPRLPLG